MEKKLVFSLWFVVLWKIIHRFMATLFFNRPTQKEEDAGGFEPEERKTPWLGRVLLLILTGVLLYFGLTGISDLELMIEQPETLSVGCYGIGYNVRYGHIDRITRDQLYLYDLYQGESYEDEETDYLTGFPAPKICTFSSSYEVKAGVPDAYQDVKAVWQEKDNFERTTLQPLQEQLYQIKTQISQKEREYNVSLQEVQAGRPPVGKTAEQLRQELQSLRPQQERINQQIAAATTRVQVLDDKLAEKEAILVQRINEAIDLYNNAWAHYKFKVFLLELFFVIPLFVVSVWFYFRLLKKNSPHTIIFLPIVFVAAVLLAKTIITYFWASFLADLLEIILRFTEQLIVLRIFLYYVGMFLAIILFGGAVFLLQRKIFSPARVRLRRLKSKKCPNCEAPMDFGKSFCVACGSRLVEKCASCGQDRYLDFKFCPYCGK